MRSFLDQFADYQRSIPAKEGHVRMCQYRLQRLLDVMKVEELEQITPGKMTEALASLRKEGLGLMTLNHYLRTARAWLRWCLFERHLERYPLERVKIQNARADVRHGRRALAVPEEQALLAATLAGRCCLGFDPLPRYWLYKVAVNSGLRASELASLSPGSFDPVAMTVTVEAAFAKNGRTDTLPLPSALFWERRGRDSNPRSGCPDSGFQDRCNRPLCHPSGGYKNPRKRRPSPCFRIVARPRL
jgi:integrase